MKVLITGNFSEEHVGAHFLNAASQLNLDVWGLDYHYSNSAIPFMNKLYWRMDRRPARLENYADAAINLCKLNRIDALVATGMAPYKSGHLKELKKLGVHTACVLTDNPWNPALKAQWLLDSLPNYQAVFNPRSSIHEELRALNASTYRLPFAYSSLYHFYKADNSFEKTASNYDLLFIGGADNDRAKIIRQLLPLKINIGLYGGYWNNYPDLISYHHGFVYGSTLRSLIYRAKINLCLVRRANRDGHVMRSYEIPAIGGCMLTEYTDEHAQILGPDGDTACYFHNTTELVEKVKRLLGSPQQRSELALKAHQRIVAGSNSYTDRLKFVLDKFV